MSRGVEGPEDRRLYRMRDLCAMTGMSRQAVHFYIQQGLVPGGDKTGRNMAWYGQEHVDRLLAIRALQHERFLPLKAIKALLAGETGAFDSSQREALLELRDRLGPELGIGGEGGERPLDAATLARTHGVPPGDVERLAGLGLLAARTDPGGGLAVAAEDLWVLELWAELRAAGFTEELGFTVDDLAMYEELVAELFRKELALVVERLDGLPADRAAAMIERALPLVHKFLGRAHKAQVTKFFRAMA